MLARMGAMLELKADEPTREIVRDLKDMETARQALIRDRTAAKARLSVATLPLLRKQAALVSLKSVIMRSGGRDPDQPLGQQSRDVAWGSSARPIEPEQLPGAAS